MKVESSKMKLLTQIALLSSFSIALAKHVWRREAKPRFIRYQSWNMDLYPVWKEGDPRYKTSWTGGEVKFDVSSDGPVLTGARVTFSINIVFPAHHAPLPDGQVVWAINCTVNGTEHHVEEPVYPQDSAGDKQNMVFPDGSPLCKNRDKKPPFVFVWKTWGKYWQVSDGPSSSLTISTDGIRLGSYLMDVVIYHYRNRDKFIPIGYASTEFCITDQIPFAVTLTQVNDKDKADHIFIRNRAVVFRVALHDPSGYLDNADITFNWDFGDSSGTVIARELTTTHTYTTSGLFEPQVVVQAAIPDPACIPPSNGPVSAKPTAEAYLPGTAANRIAVIDGETVRAHSDIHIEKHQASDAGQDCVIYRYGSFSTGIEVVEGIERVEIIPAGGGFFMTELEQHAVDFTVTCQGSLPTEVCIVVSDAECLSPGKTTCSTVSPSPYCHLVLRHFFNNSGIFCLNVSLTNDVSLAVSSARVNVIIGSSFTRTSAVAMTLSILLMASAVGAVAIAYKHMLSYKLQSKDAPADHSVCGGGRRSALLWSLVNRLPPTQHWKRLPQDATATSIQRSFKM